MACAWTWIAHCMSEQCVEACVSMSKHFTINYSCASAQFLEHFGTKEESSMHRISNPICAVTRKTQNALNSSLETVSSLAGQNNRDARLEYMICFEIDNFDCWTLRLCDNYDLWCISSVCVGMPTLCQEWDWTKNNTPDERHELSKYVPCEMDLARLRTKSFRLSAYATNFRCICDRRNACAVFPLRFGWYLAGLQQNKKQPIIYLRVDDVFLHWLHVRLEEAHAGCCSLALWFIFFCLGSNWNARRKSRMENWHGELWVFEEAIKSHLPQPNAMETVGPSWRKCDAQQPKSNGKRAIIYIDLDAHKINEAMS